jgi:hypothetical protein
LFIEQTGFLIFIDRRRKTPAFRHGDTSRSSKSHCVMQGVQIEKYIVAKGVVEGKKRTILAFIE